jgi:phosphatidylglycerophosphatase C
MQRLAVFDFDGTLIKGDSIVRYILYAVSKGYLSPFNLPYQLYNVRRTLTGRISNEEGKSNALAFLGRMNMAEQEAFNAGFCKDKLLPRLYKLGIERMEKHRRQGDLVLLLSASPACYMDYVKDLLPVDEVLASPTDAYGKVTVTTRHHEKVKRLQSFTEGMDIDWENSWAYGDSAADLPVMRLTGHPVLVNPKPAMLKAGQGLPVEMWLLS